MRCTPILARLAAGALLLAAPAFAAEPKAPAKKAAVDPGKPTFGTFGFDVAGMDRQAAPGEDWCRYANGTYQKNLEIPADKASFGMFHLLHELSQERTRAIIEAAAADKEAKKGSEAQKVGDYYASYMDEAGIEALGMAPVKPLLDLVAGIKDKVDLAVAYGRMARKGVGTPVGVGPMQDLKNPEVYAVYVGQGGLGLPDRDYYLDTENPKFAEVRTAYAAHIAAMLKLAGFDGAEARAEAIVALETRIAKAHWSQVEMRQIDKLYNPVAVADLDKAYPGLNWGPLLAALTLQGQKQLVVTAPSAIQGIAKLIASEPLAVWKDHLAFHALSRVAPVLPKAVADQNFAFYGTVLSGQPQQEPRWQRAVTATTGAVGEAAGKLYVAKHFPPEAKAQTDRMVKDIIAAMDGRLEKLPWMDPKTRAEARTKLAKFTPKIGYPEKWRDYSRLEVKRGDALGNALRTAEFNFQREVAKIGKPIDRSEWGMTPMEVNAYANPFWNEIVFPAAILQPPFFDPKADPAVNYGAIGVVIGHEISHHFDDQGRKFDQDGKLSDWWTAEDVARFKTLTDKLVAQYAAYEALPGQKVNGELTLGENIADLAGLTVAYDAYQRSLNGKPGRTIGGYTADQRFFLGFAQVWRSKYRDADLLRRLKTDPHTPAFLRPNVVRNLDAWYAAFPSKPGQALHLEPKDRVRIW